MKKSLFQITMIIPVILLLCFAFSCKKQVTEEAPEGITEEEAKALVERDLEIWNEGNLALADELIAPDYVQHAADTSEDIVGIDAFKEGVAYLRTEFPDSNLTVEELIVKNDRIVWRWIFTGTNTGTTSDIPPTGKKVRIEGVGILRVANGKIVERLIYNNEVTQLRQLGYTITPPQPSEEK